MIAFDNFCTIGKGMNNLPRYKLLLQLYYVSTLPAKTKNSKKWPIAYCNAYG